eukprot:418150-Pleurochrysis_carterae.AAC.1
MSARAACQSEPGSRNASCVSTCHSHTFRELLTLSAIGRAPPARVPTYTLPKAPTPSSAPACQTSSPSATSPPLERSDRGDDDGACSNKPPAASSEGSTAATSAHCCASHSGSTTGGAASAGGPCGCSPDGGRVAKRACGGGLLRNLRMPRNVAGLTSEPKTVSSTPKEAS